MREWAAKLSYILFASQVKDSRYIAMDLFQLGTIGKAPEFPAYFNIYLPLSLDPQCLVKFSTKTNSHCREDLRSDHIIRVPWNCRAPVMANMKSSRLQVVPN